MNLDNMLPSSQEQKVSGPMVGLAEAVIATVAGAATVGILLGGGMALARRDSGKKELTYPEAIRYFLEDRPADSRIVRGIIMRAPASKGSGFVVTRAFVDGNNQIVAGRKDRVRRFDQELSEAFGEKDLIVVE